MATPSTQIIAIWIKDSLILNQWVSLRDLAVQTLKVRWKKDEFDILDFLQDKLPYIAEHLRNDLAASIEDGKIREFEIDTESPPYIRRIVEKDRELLNKLRKIEPFRFEYVCAKILEALGAESSVTQNTHDGGVDFFATKLKVVPTILPMPISCHCLVIGQAKRYQEGAAISETRLREFVGASILQRHRLSFQSQLGPLVPTLYAFWTTSDLDSNARLFAKNVGVWYMDGQTLAAYVKELQLRDYVMLLPDAPSFSSCPNPR